MRPALNPDNNPDSGANQAPAQNANSPFVYDRVAPVSQDVWKAELAFDRLDGSERETKARNSNDWEHWYNNYVNQWTNADAATRYAIDQQHGFYGGLLTDNTPAPVEEGGGGGGETKPPKPPKPPKPIADPDPEDISPDPQDESTNDGSDMTPEDNETAIDSELIDEDRDEELSQDPDTNVEDDSLLTVRDVTPQDEVVDPATGRRYPTPADARRAGITNWVYAHDYTGGG